MNDSLTRFSSLYAFLANEAKLLDDIVCELGMTKASVSPAPLI